MDDLTTAELLELAALFDAAIDMQYQIWISVTFALVIVSYAARNELSRNVRWIAAGLYLLVITAIAGRSSLQRHSVRPGLRYSCSVS